MNSNIFWDDEKKSIKGSFVNLVITVMIFCMLTIAICFSSKEMIQNLKELQGFIISFFGISFGLWAGKSVIETALTSAKTTTPTDTK